MAKLGIANVVIGAVSIAVTAQAAVPQAFGSAGMCPDRPVAIAACTAAAPAVGQTFSGPVVQVIDARTLCVAQGPTPSEWILVRLQASAEGARGALTAVAFARRISCVARQPTDQGLEARCDLNGLDLGAAMRAPIAAANWR